MMASFKYNDNIYIKRKKKKYKLIGSVHMLFMISRITEKN